MCIIRSPARITVLALAEPAGGVMYEDLSMLIRSAIDGDGVALVRHVIVMQEIAAGRLVRLFGTVAASRDDYYLVSPPGAAAKPQVLAFRAWLLGEIAAFTAQLDLHDDLDHRVG